MAIITGTNNNDNLYGTASADWMYGYAGNDKLYGYGGNDFLYGHDGADQLNGGTGNDSMTGGGGNDIYYVDSMLDTITEFAGGGTDKVYSSVSTNVQWLPANVENLTLTGTAYFGDGNSLNNIIVGTNGANSLYGYDGNDSLYGYGGDDFLNGGNGNDKLNGGAGNDSMTGGGGNDIYYVDSMSDTITEFAGGGTDKVYSSVSTNVQWLPANVENLTLTGTAYFGDGNSLNNVIYGTNSANSLYGYAGNDRLYGLGGDDSLSGGDGNDTLEGGSGNDWLYGGNGNDRLAGGAGNDTLYGDAGYDQFRFTSLTDGVDTIKSFNASQDSIGLNAQAGEAFNQGLSFNASGVLNSAWYFEGAGYNGNGTQLSGIFVDTTTGYVWYNPTSSVAGDSYHFATIDPATVVGSVSSLSAADFVLI